MRREVKRGQVTIFIIVAVLIVVAVSLYFVFREKIDLNGVDSEIEPVHDFVIDCVEETGENALRKIGEQGGHFFIFDEPTLANLKVPYYIYNGENYVPSMDEIERELSFFINEEMSFCILNFKDFRDEFNISHELNGVVVDVLNEAVIFRLDYPIYLIKEDEGFEFNEFEVSVPVRLGVIYDVVLEIVSEQEAHLDSICLSCLHDLEMENELDIEMIDYGEGVALFTIVDDKFEINNEVYEFSFAIEYG